MKEESEQNFPEDSGSGPEEAKNEAREYTLKNYEKAKEELSRANEIGFRGNNPEAGRARQQDAASRVRESERALKKSGQLEMTPGEKLTVELDKLYPDAKSRTVVDYKGQKYQIRYRPLSASRTGKTVFEWGHEWIPFIEKKPKRPKKPKK